MEKKSEQREKKSFDFNKKFSDESDQKGFSDFEQAESIDDFNNIDDDLLYSGDELEYDENEFDEDEF